MLYTLDKIIDLILKFRHVCVSLQNNDTVTELDLSDNAIGDAGASYIAQTIDYNKNITHLVSINMWEILSNNLSFTKIV